MLKGALRISWVANGTTPLRKCFLRSSYSVPAISVALRIDFPCLKSRCLRWNPSEFWIVSTDPRYHIFFKKLANCVPFALLSRTSFRLFHVFGRAASNEQTLSGNIYGPSYAIIFIIPLGTPLGMTALLLLNYFSGILERERSDISSLVHEQSQRCMPQFEHPPAWARLRENFLFFLIGQSDSVTHALKPIYAQMKPVVGCHIKSYMVLSPFHQSNISNEK